MLPTHLFCLKTPAWRRVGSEVRPCLLERAPRGVETTASQDMGRILKLCQTLYLYIFSRMCFATLQVVNMFVFMGLLLFGSVGIIMKHQSYTCQQAFHLGSCR